MKLLTLTAVLALAGSPALAEWSSLGDVGNAELFVDRATIVRRGELATMWSVSELKAPAAANGVAYVSLKRQDEFDCAGSRSRGLQISAYPLPMGEGKAVATEKGTRTWQPVAPQSVTEALLKIACAKEG